MYAINLVYCVTFYKQRFMFDLFINYLLPETESSITVFWGTYFFLEGGGGGA